MVLGDQCWLCMDGMGLAMFVTAFMDMGTGSMD